MRHNVKKSYKPPSIAAFANREEAWEAYKDKGTPEQRERLREMLRLDDGDDSSLVPHRRRA